MAPRSQREDVVDREWWQDKLDELSRSFAVVGIMVVLVYLLCIGLIGLPVLMSEALIGKFGRRSPARSVAAIAQESGASKAWSIVGTTGSIAGFLILSFYVVIAGFGIGATSPLQGIYGSELFGSEELGQGMGVVTMVFGLAASLAPALVAVLNDVQPTRWWAISISATTAALAALAVNQPERSTG